MKKKKKQLIFFRNPVKRQNKVWFTFDKRKSNYTAIKVNFSECC